MYVRTYRGLGDAASNVQLGSSLASPVGAAVGGTALASSIGIGASIAVPVVGAALAAITIAAVKLIQNSGCGPTCIQASDYANQAEPLLRQNLNAYFALPKPRGQSAQQAALQNFDSIWAQAVKLWQDPALGNAGKKAISDRQSGACTWKQTANYGTDITAAGEPGIGQCWNWFSGYRDPIANDPNVTSDAQANLPGSSGSLSFTGGDGSSLLPLALIAGLVLLGVALL